MTEVPLKAALRALEPLACADDQMIAHHEQGVLSVTEAAVLSQAVSLKRIADALAGVGPSILTAPLNSYGEGLGDAIQGQMIRGQRGIDQYEGGKG